MPVHVEIRSERYETEEFDAGMQDGKAVILKKKTAAGKKTIRFRPGRPV